MMAYYPQQPQTNVIQVSGEQEVRSFQFAPNSTFAFFDRNEPVIYYVRSDASGRVTVDVLDFVIRPDPKVVQQETEMNELRQRLAAIESMLGGLVHESTVSKSTAAGAVPTGESAPAVQPVP
jgi:hypothetical protein